ncbi:MAG: SGNH/GDSL hydrolase family protein, partial [Chloroflexia bacterium]|nr:SGNH/GDSL hydrolase family protein [Chloroflexia bacterium]
MQFFFMCNGQQSITFQNNNMTKQKTYLALGDSYTIGESVDENDRWPVQLTNEINKRGYHFS